MSLIEFKQGKWNGGMLQGVICDIKVPFNVKEKFYSTTIRPEMLYVWDWMLDNEKPTRK